MSYELKSLPSALKEWKILDSSIMNQFKKKLQERLQHPRVHASKLHGFSDHYKIKLRSVGYRLIYGVIDKDIVVFMIAVGKREGGEVYQSARKW